MLLELADRLWQGDEPIEEHHPVGYTGQLTVLAEGTAFLPSFANVTAFETADGLVLVDTGGYVIAAQVHEQIRAWSDLPLHTAIYSHGHVDHVFGVPHFEAEEGAGPARVVAHENVPRRFDRYALTAGYNGTINARQFQLPELAFPTEFRYPDETYRSEMALEVGGERFELHHAKGETDDHTWTWVPSRRVLCCGDLFIWATPNAGQPAEGTALPARVGRGAARDGRAGRRDDAARPRPARGRGGAGAGRAHGHRRPARVAGRADARADERGRAPRPDPAVGEGARGAGGQALPARDLRRARVHRAQPLAALRRLVRRRPRPPEAGSRRTACAGAGGDGRRRRAPGRAGPGALGRGRFAAGRTPRPARVAGRATVADGPGDPGRGLRASRRRGAVDHGARRVRLDRRGVAADDGATASRRERGAHRRGRRLPSLLVCLAAYRVRSGRPGRAALGLLLAALLALYASDQTAALPDGERAVDGGRRRPG